MRRGEAGFTLLEMLVALVVFGLVMAGIAQTFRFGLAAWRSGPARTAEPESLGEMDGALTRMMAKMLPGTMAGNGGEVAFTTSLPPGAGLGNNLADTAIALLPDGRLVLRYRQHPAGPPLTPLPAPQTELLASGVRVFEVRYLVLDKNKHPVWGAKWKGNGLPLLVRLHIDLDDGRQWPDLIVAPVVGGN